MSNNMICGKLVSGEFFIGKLIDEKDENYQIENLMCILLQPTDQEGKIGLGLTPLNPFGQKGDKLEINKKNIMFRILDIPEMIVNQFNMITSDIIIPMPKVKLN